jgi:hypothetical protein
MRGMRWAGNVECMGNMGEKCIKICGRKAERKRTLRRYRLRGRITLEWILNRTGGRGLGSRGS